MITIKTETVKKCGDYDKMNTTVEINGQGTIILEEFKTLLQYCRTNDELRPIMIHAISEVLHDN